MLRWLKSTNSKHRLLLYRGTDKTFTIKQQTMANNANSLFAVVFFAAFAVHTQITYIVYFKLIDQECRRAKNFLFSVTFSVFKPFY